MIRAVIFDFNGVLVDDEHVHFELFREVLAGEGITLTEQQYHEEYLGYDDRRCFEAAVAAAGQSTAPNRIDRLITRKARRYGDVAVAGLRYFPGAAECVAALAERWPVAICSGALRSEIELALETMGVRDRVAAIISAEETTRCKPDPEGYRLALEALRGLPGRDVVDLQPDQCVVVEDSLAGVAAARAAGMHAVGVANTYAPDALRAAGADVVLEGLTRMTPRWVESRFPASGAGECNGHG